MSEKQKDTSRIKQRQKSLRQEIIEMNDDQFLDWCIKKQTKPLLLSLLSLIVAVVALVITIKEFW